MPESLTIGRYELLGELGRGGMAVVYLARQQDLDRTVALKELGSMVDLDKHLAERFVREARMAGSLTHPNIVTVHEYFEHGGRAYIAVEYLPRGSLRPEMSGLGLARTATVMEGVLAGLGHAERSHIVHRDLKPENLMLTTDGAVKIADFGIAKALNEVGVELTVAGTTIGTPAYMAPEQATAREIGPWTDLYAVGVIAYEIFAGHVPFADADDAMTLLSRRVRETPPSLTAVRADIDPGLAHWVDRLLEPDPSRRTRTAAEAWDELEDIVIRLLGPRWRRGGREDDRPEPAPAGPAVAEIMDPHVTEVRDAPTETGEFRTYLHVTPPPAAGPTPPEPPPVERPDTLVYAAVPVPPKPPPVPDPAAIAPSVAATPELPSLPVRGSTPPGASWVWPRVGAAARRRRWHWLPIGAVVLIVCAAAAYALTRPSSAGGPNSGSSTTTAAQGHRFDAVLNTQVGHLLAASAASRKQVRSGLQQGSTPVLAAAVKQRHAEVRRCRALPALTGPGAGVVHELCAALTASLLADARYATNDVSGGNTISEQQAQPLKEAFAKSYAALCKRLGLKPSRFAGAGVF